MMKNLLIFKYPTSLSADRYLHTKNAQIFRIVVSLSFCFTAHTRKHQMLMRRRNSIVVSSVAVEVWCSVVEQWIFVSEMDSDKKHGVQILSEIGSGGFGQDFNSKF